MKRLSDYEILKQRLFYKGWHILEYIEHKELTKLDITAIKATIMDALVSNCDIDPSCEYLDFNNLCITRDRTVDTYEYEKYPNICGIPLWMKKKFRTKSCHITGGIPISVFLSIPSNNRCVYDMNTAVSALFEDCAFYIVSYYSPTRPGKVAKKRPFVEVDIDGIPYLVDNLTRRIIRRDFFEKNYGFDIDNSFTKKSLEGEKKKYYLEAISDFVNMIPYLSLHLSFDEEFRTQKDCAEHAFELEESKKYFEGAWIEYEKYDKEKQNNEDFQKIKKEFMNFFK